MAKLRNITFFTLSAVNSKIQELLVGLNNKQFQKMDGSRKSQFELLDQPALKPLPLTRYEYSEEKNVKLHIDYHFEVKGHYYSAPYTLAGKTLTAKYTASKVVALYNGQKVAVHVRNYKRGTHTTLSEHMPEKHKKHLTWTVDRFLSWADAIGPRTSLVVANLIKKKKHPEQSYRACLGLLNLSKIYNKSRLEIACDIAIEINSVNRASIAEILKNGMDKVRQKDDTEDDRTVQDHKNIRGPKYFTKETQEV
jgi:transposase